MSIQNIIAYIEHNVTTERWWTIPGAINDYLVLDDRDEAYKLLDALADFRGANTQKAVQGALVIAELIAKKIEAAYKNDADEYAREQAEIARDQYMRAVANG